MPWMLLFVMASVLLPVHATLADDALVLPQGRWRVSAEARFSLPITKRFTPDGGTEDLAADFNRELNQSLRQNTPTQQGLCRRTVVEL